VIPFPHLVEIVADFVVGPLDPEGGDRGHPSTVEAVVDVIPGWIQPKGSRERASVRSDDVNVGSHRIYLDAVAIPIVDEDMRLRHDSVANGDGHANLDGTYRIVGLQDAAGVGHHLAVDADRIRP
jgi:hypothetical protein